MNCSCCKSPKNVNDLDNTFDLDGARKDARHYRKHGLGKRAQKFLDIGITTQKTLKITMRDSMQN